jgi:hypothetical protein
VQFCALCRLQTLRLGQPPPKTLRNFSIEVIFCHLNPVFFRRRWLLRRISNGTICPLKTGKPQNKGK